MTAATKIVLTAIRQDGSEEFLSSREVRAGENVDLHSEARVELERRRASDFVNARRLVRYDRPDTVSVRADLKAGSTLIDRDEAH